MEYSGDMPEPRGKFKTLPYQALVREASHSW